MAALRLHYLSVHHTCCAWMAASALLLGGCSGGRIYQATNLPAQFVTAKRENAQTVDLSRLAAAAISSESIDRGDVLEITIDTGYGTQRDNTSPVRIGEDGTAMVPLVGKVNLAGLELEGAEQAIAQAGVERGVFRQPHVTVVMKKQRINKVTVIGAVEKPGVKELPRGKSDLLAALVEAGGLSKEAGTDVEIRHPGAPPESAPQGGDRLTGRPQTSLAGFQTAPGAPQPAPSFRVNLVSAAKQGNGGYWLRDGDVVMVEKRDPQPVHVMGLVKEPKEIELPVNRDLHVLDALALAGGERSDVADKIHVIRQLPGREEPVVIEISLKEAKRVGKGNLRLAPGDVVSVEQTPATIFVDTLKSFIHFGLGATFPIFR